MTDNNYAPVDMHLYQELRGLFPWASEVTLAQVINKNRNHRQCCIDDLMHSISGQRDIPSQMDNYNLYNYLYRPDNRQQGTGPGTRSRSVSGVPGASSAEEARGYGFGYANLNQGRGRSPQSAPVVPVCRLPFSPRSGFSFSNNGGMENINSGIQSQHVHAPSASLDPGKLPQPTNPSAFEQQHQMQPPPYSRYPINSDSMPRAQHSFYPTVAGKYYSAASPSSQPTRHTTTLNVMPSAIHPGGSFGVDDNAWPLPYGWNPSLGTHSTSVNLQLGPPPNDMHPQVQITTSGSMNYGTGNTTPGGHVPLPHGGTIPVSSPHPSVPYQSQLRISISPNGGSISAMRSQLHPSLSLSPGRFQNQISTERISPGSVGFSPTYISSPGNRLSTPSQASPRTSPKFTEDSPTKLHSIFDEEDPEQEKVTQTPLKPVPSPSAIPSWNVESGWPMASTPNNLVPPNELCSGEAYSQALLTHQRHKFHTLQIELDREKSKLQDLRKDVAHVEFYFYQQVHCKDQIFFSFDDLQKLRSEVRSLMVDCDCMSRLVDVLHRGQVPLGETNEDFYRTINTGQQGPVLLNPQPNLLTTIPSTAQQATNQSANWSRPSMPLPPSSPQPPQVAPTLQDSAQPSGASRHPPQQNDDEEGQKWACCTCTFHNNPAMVICEMCEMPKFVQGEETHNLKIHVRQNSSCAAASKALQLKLVHRLGAVKR